MRYLMLFVAAVMGVLACRDKTTDTKDVDTSAAEKMIRQLEDKADKNPDSISYRFAVIDALDSLGRFKEALTHMTIVLKKDSTNNSFWARNGQLLERSGDTTAAIESYIRSINIYADPNNQLYLANILAERKDDRALLLVNNVSKVQFDDETLANCDFIAGIYHARKGNIQMAEQLFNRCIAHDRKYMVAYLEKGFLYFDRKKFDEALRIFQAAGNVEPTYADAFYWQAKTLEASGKTQEAVKMYEQSLNLDPKLKEAADALARLGSVRS